MNIFHIDMNTAHFRADYLEKWLIKLKQAGYDAILWEMENGIKWKTAPRCYPEDAFSKPEARRLLKSASKHGFQNIPLLQTLGHCEYILKDPSYVHLRELREADDQYCPASTSFRHFIKTWISEIVDLFDGPELFHIGSDEANHLGECPECRKKGPAGAFTAHVSDLARFLAAKGVQTGIWNDMIMKYPEHLAKLSKDIWIFDWRYERRDGGKVSFWGKDSYRQYSAVQIPPAERKKFAKYLFPGERKKPDDYYTTAYAADRGFRVVTCGASSAFGDTSFLPIRPFRMQNTLTSLQSDRQKRLAGFLQTSWTAHLHPWELQEPEIFLPAYFRTDFDLTLDAYQQTFLADQYGLKGEKFWQAVELLSKNSLFNHTADIGKDKRAERVDPYIFQKRIAEMSLRGQSYIRRQLKKIRLSLGDYRKAAGILKGLKPKRNTRIIEMYRLAAQNLVTRAETAEFFLTEHAVLADAVQIGVAARKKARELMKRTEQVRQKTERMYAAILKPLRLGLYLDWIYGPAEHALRMMLSVK